MFSVKFMTINSSEGSWGRGRGGQESFASKLTCNVSVHQTMEPLREGSVPLHATTCRIPSRPKSPLPKGQFSSVSCHGWLHPPLKHSGAPSDGAQPSSSSQNSAGEAACFLHSWLCPAGIWASLRCSGGCSETEKHFKTQSKATTSGDFRTLQQSPKS